MKSALLVKITPFRLRILAIILCLLICVIFICQLNPRNGIERLDKFDIDSLFLLSDEITRAVIYSQNDDGGYGNISYLYDDLYYSLYCTYTAYCYLSYTDSLSNEDILTLSSLLNDIGSSPFLLNTNTYDDIFQLYYYICLCSIANIEISDSLTNIIISFVNDMYCDKGFFHRSYKEKAECDNQEQYTDETVKNLSTYRSLYILSALDGLDDFRVKYMHDYLSILNAEFVNVDLNVVDTYTISKLAHYIRCNLLLGNDMTSNSGEFLFLTQSWIDSINNNEISADIYLLYELSTCTSFLSSFTEAIDLQNIIDLTIKQLESEKQGYYDPSFINISRMSLGYETLDNLGAGKQVVNRFSQLIFDQLNKCKERDGSFIFREQYSYPHFTYYATKILELLGHAENEKVKKYISNELVNINVDSDLSKIFIMKMAILVEQSISTENILAFVDKRKEEIQNGSIQYTLVNEILFIMKYLGINLEKQEKDDLLSEYFNLALNGEIINSLEINDIANQFIRCSAYNAKLLVASPPSDSEISAYLRDLVVFSDNYIKSAEYDDGVMILLTYYLLDLACNYGVDDLLDLDNVLRHAYQAITELYYNGFIRFEKEQRPAWEITYYSSIILHYLKTHYV